MSTLFFRFVQIATLRAGPQDLPGFPGVLWVAAGLVFIASAAGLSFAYPLSDVIFRCAAAIVVPGAILYAGLQLKGKKSRFIQCYAAICGASAVVYMVALPLMPAFYSVSVSDLSGKLVVMVILLLDIWSLLITAHIFKQTFEVGLATGVSLALALMVVTLLAIEVIAPVPAINPEQQSVLTIGENLMLVNL